MNIIVISLVIIQLTMNVFTFSQFNNTAEIPDFSWDLPTEILHDVDDAEQNAEDEIPASQLHIAYSISYISIEENELINQEYEHSVDISTPPPQYNS